MTFCHPHNHPWSFTTDVLLVRQLLARDSSARENVWDQCRRCILIPWGVHLSYQCNSRDRSSSLSLCTILQPPNRSRGPILHYGPFHQHRHSISRRTWGFRSLYGHGDLLFEKHWDIGDLSRERMRSPHSIICFQGRGSPVHL